MIQQTLVVIKPDGVKRNLIGEIISRYEKEGLVVKQLKMLTVSRELVEKHYPEDDEYMISIGKKSAASDNTIVNFLEQGRMVVKGLQDYITSGPVVAMVLEGEEAIPNVRKITGYTNPPDADEGTIRRDLGIDSFKVANAEKRPCYNLIHASGNPEEAEKEIALWFPE